jgi:hypothetical protein
LTSGTFIAKVILFIQDMFFYYCSIRDDNFRPESGLRMYNHPVPQDYSGTYNGIILDTAVLTNMRIIIHDTSGDGAVRPDNYPVIERR